MDGFSFLIRLVEATTWPLVALIAVFVFRKEFRALLPLIRKLKAGPIEAEFEHEVQVIAREAVGIATTETREEIDPQRKMLADLVQVNPRSAILEAWLGVESAVRRAALQRIPGSPPPDVSSPNRAIRELIQYQVINSDDFALFHDLRGLRNQAAHLSDFNPSQEAALNFVNLASRLQSRLEELAAPS